MLTDIVIDIHQRETGELLAADTVAKLRDLADEYGVDENPRWLLPLFSAVQRGQEISPPVFFEREGSDPHSYLFELGLLLGWTELRGTTRSQPRSSAGHAVKFEHEGEYDAIEFPRLRARVYLSHEATSSTTGRGGSSYEVSRLSDET